MKIQLLKKSSPSTLIEQLQQLMITRNISEAELSRQTNIPQPTLHKILAGKTADPRASTLRLLADYFNVSVDQLITGVFIGQANEQVSTETQSIPIISWQDCIQGSAFIQTLTPSSWSDWVVIEYQADNVYALLSKPCMEPRFPKGTTLIVDPDFGPADGDLVVVHYPETQEATLREYSSDGPIKLLMPVGSNAHRETLTENIKIIGVVIQSRFAYHN